MKYMQTSLFGTDIKPQRKKPAAKKRAARKKTVLITDAETVTGAFSPEAEEKVLAVGEYLDYINHVLKVAGNIKVRGEISKVTNHPTGVYMTIKDAGGDGVLDCYINPYTYRGLGMQLEEGMEVKITGVPSIFKRRSQLSLKVENVELTGEGTLKKAYELLKLKLEQEGLFDRKRELPEFISSLGIITSKTGAVIDDFRNNLSPLGCSLRLIDCRVEGVQAANQIIAAIQYFNVHHPELDCLVVMRGGGSLEDMQAFNNEAVVKQVFASRIPVIAAIGHDRDLPLACLAADRFTSTPTAAAVLINNSWSRLITSMPELQQAIMYRFENYLDTEYGRLSNTTQQLIGRVNVIFQRFKYLSDKIVWGAKQVETAIGELMQKALLILNDSFNTVEMELRTYHSHIATAEKLISAGNPERNLKLGYSLTRDSSGSIIRSAGDIAKDATITIQLHKGSIDAEVINTKQ